MSEPLFKYVQTVVSNEEAQEIDDYLHAHGIKNKREWLRETILKEVRQNGSSNTKPLPLH